MYTVCMELQSMAIPIACHKCKLHVGDFIIV